MKSNRPKIAGILVLGLSWIVLAGSIDTPPVANRIEHREERHGATVIDNYFWLRDKSNPAVIEYLEGYASVRSMIADLTAFLEKRIAEFSQANRSHLTIAVGCTGGQHRSVFMAEEIRKQLAKAGYRAKVEHRDSPR